jgi:hypothetical protein
VTRMGVIHNVSRFMVPLSDDGVNVSKVVFTRISSEDFLQRTSSTGSPNRIGQVQYAS